MSKFRNEHGAALVVTLMIVTLFLLFILTQFYQITNTTKQVNKVEQTIDTRLIAEMGIDYYRSKIDQFKNDQSITEFLEGFPRSVDVDEDRKFIIEQETISEEEDKITIQISSIGIAYGNDVTIQDELIINLP